MTARLARARLIGEVMMVWAAPITTADDLMRRVVLGTTAESETLEFKEKLTLTTDEAAREVARDIAGLANTYGGSLIIGVEETTGQDSPYKVAKGFTSVVAPEVLRQQLEDRVRKFLAPSTVPYTVVPLTASINSLPVVLVVVNVPPCEEGLVAVWLAGTRTMEFPWRTSFGKRYLNPGEVEACIRNTSRALELRLRRMTAPDVPSMLYSPVELGAANGWFPTTPQRALVDLSAEHFTLILTEQEGRPSLVVPYGALVEVWKTGSATGLMLRYTIRVPMKPGNGAYLHKTVG